MRFVPVLGGAGVSGFSGVVDLLKTAKHGPGEKVYLIEFVYEDAGDGGSLSVGSSESRKAPDRNANKQDQ
jgi:hypothetical protein